MNKSYIKKSLIVLDEKYLSIIATIIAFCVGILFYNKWEIDKWLGSNSISFLLSAVVMPFILTAKGIIMTLSKDDYEGIKALENKPKTKKRFYSYIDKTIYASFFIIIINIVFLFAQTFINPPHFVLQFICCPIIAGTVYLLFSIKRVLQCINVIQKMSFKNQT